MSKIKRNPVLVLLCIVCICFFANTTAYTQPHIQEIQDHPELNFIQQSVVEFQSGLYVVVGTVMPGEIYHDSNIVVMMTDNSGNIIWDKYVDYGQDEFVGSVIIDSNQDIVLTGYTGQNGGTTPNKDLIVVKLNSSGDLLRDIIIQDVEPGFGYSVYGLDIEEIESEGDCFSSGEGGYMIVGTGAQGATAAAPKYGFVLGVDMDLNGVLWGRSYQSTGTTNEFDSFNHILKVNHPWGFTMYLLTGSGKDDDPTSNKQMVANDLIMADGNSLWNTPSGNIDMTGYDNPGVMSLYNKDTNKFYVLYHGGENQPMLLELDTFTGNAVNSWALHDTSWVDFNYIITGMIWKDSTQTEIVFSGYFIHYQPDYGWPITIHADINNPAQVGIRLIQYYPQFDSNDYFNINLDFIVNPLNYVITGSADIVNQHYYKPKSLVHSLSNSGYQFGSPQQSNTGDPFAFNFMNTDSNAELEPECFDKTGISYRPFHETIEFNNFNSSPHSFEAIGEGADVYAANISSNLRCASSSALFNNSGQGKTVNDNNSQQISIYPNPSDNKVYLKPVENIDKIQVYSITGEKIKLPVFENSLDFSELASGVYLIEVTKKDGMLETYRVIKK